MRVLVAGATGFVGRRLTPVLAAAGHEVVALTRHPDGYRGPGEAAGGDVTDAESLAAAMEGCVAAYYLVHSLAEADFADKDAEGARTFARVAARAGLERIVYLGGLGDSGDDLSAHLRSRRQVERLLGGDGVPVTTLRAGIVIGHGGISWELTRQLVNHLPVMLTPRWVSTRTQPIAIADVIALLAGVLDEPAAAGRTFDVGGPEVLTYREMLQRTARIEHRPLLVVGVPLLTPRLSSGWLSLITSVDAQTARSLVDSMTNEVVVRDGDAITRLLPIRRTPFDEAVRTALAERDADRSGV